MLTLQNYVGNVQRNLCRSSLSSALLQMANLQSRLKGGCSQAWLPLLREVVAQVVQDFILPLAFQVFLQAAQGQSDDIAMMQLGSEVRLELEPEVVRAVEVFGPETGWMGAQVDVDERPVRGDDFEREGVARLGQFFPGEADVASEFLGIHFGGNAGDEARGLQLGRARDS